jgi:hypothetical protein
MFEKLVELARKVVEQPWWILALIGGIILILAPTVTIDKDNHWITHPPSTYIPDLAGGVLLLASIMAFGYTFFRDNSAIGVDLRKVKDENGVLSTFVGDCEIRVVNGSINDYSKEPSLAVVLPCNKYFDDECAQDTKSALGAYVNRVFEGQVDAFMALARAECLKKFGAGTEQQKTNEARAVSFGAGQCILLVKPLGRPNAVALVSTTTQRAGEGLESRIWHLFDGVRNLTSRLADERLNQIIMPVFGSGHGGMNPSIAFVGLLLAVADAARHGRGGQRLKKATIVVFKRDAASPSQVNIAIIRRALALIGS